MRRATQALRFNTLFVYAAADRKRITRLQGPHFAIAVLSVLLWYVGEDWIGG